MNPSPPGIGNGLELGLIGNCSFNALVDEAGAVVWSCMPRPDGDPVLHALLGTTGDGASGRFVIELADQVEARQRYVGNTAILETELTDRGGILHHAARLGQRSPAGQL